MKSERRLQQERDNLAFWMRLYEQSPMAAFEALAQKLLNLEYEMFHYEDPEN